MAKLSMEVDLGLAVLCSIAEEGDTLSQGQIADVCECSRNTISQIEMRALRKLQGAAQRSPLRAYWEQEKKKRTNP